MKNNLFPIAEEGWQFIAYALGSFVLFYILDLDFLFLISFLTLVALLFVFRNPERALPIFEEKSVLSPVDGTVLSIEELEDTLFAYKVTVESSYADVAILRSPISGKVTSYLSRNGSRLGLSNSVGKKINEMTNIVFEDTQKNKVKVSHIVKQSLCGINTNDMSEKAIMQSSRYGLMLNGITEIYLPQNFRLNITTEEDLKASQSLLGYFS